MSLIPWSDRVGKSIPVLFDELMALDSEQIDPALQNALLSLDSIKKLFAPVNQINARSQADLENSILGTNLIVPDGLTIAVVIDAPFTLTKPFQIGEDSVLEFYGSVSQTEFIWDGPGKLFRNVNPANLIDSLLLHDIFIIGNTTNGLFDIQSSKFCFVTNIQAFLLADLGAIKAAIINLDRFSVAEITQGLRLTDVALCKVFSSGISNTGSPTGITFCSIKSNLAFTSVILD